MGKGMCNMAVPYPGDEFALLGEAEVEFPFRRNDVDLAIGTKRRQFDFGCNNKKERKKDII